MSKPLDLKTVEHDYLLENLVLKRQLEIYQGIVRELRKLLTVAGVALSDIVAAEEEGGA